jgi:hypothetical protein
MPKRTVKDAFFMFNDTFGRRVWAQRGETHDIPDGEDLERGDRLGAFTADGGEPPAPAGTYIPAIELSWTPQEWEAWVDAGKINEIIEKLNDVAPHERGRAASLIIQAEHGRKDKARPELLESLAKVADSAPAPLPDPTDNNTWDGNISSLTDEELATWVRRNSDEAVLAAVGADPELAVFVKEAEQVGRGRPGLLTALDERAGLSRNGQVATSEVPENTGTDDVPAVALSVDPEFAQFVVESNVPAILERVGTDVNLARQALQAEQARPENDRKSLTEALQKIVDTEA